MSMDVKIEDAGPCRRVLHVNAPAETIGDEYKQVVKAFTAAARLPGFRPGKAPVEMVERRFASQIRDEARDRLVPQYYRRALQQAGIEPVAIVEVKDVDLGRDTGLVFNVVVDVAPDFKLPKYKKLQVEAKPVAVDDQQVDESVRQLRERFGHFEDVTGRPVQDGDLVRVDYTATCEGKPLVELAADNKTLGEAQDFLVLIGEPELAPGFNAGLRGASAGDVREVSVTFPEDYNVSAVAGKVAAYSVTVKSIQERIPAALDEEFLKRFGVADEAELHNRIRQDLETEAQRQEETRRRDEVAKFLLENTQFELPQSVVDQETRLAVRSIVGEVSRRGASREQIVGQQEDIVRAATQTATDRVRLTYILTRVADEENVTVTEEQLAERIRALAWRYQMTPEKLRDDLEKRNALENVRSELRADLAMNRLLELTLKQD